PAAGPPPSPPSLLLPVGPELVVTLLPCRREISVGLLWLPESATSSHFSGSAVVPASTLYTATAAAHKEDASGRCLQSSFAPSSTSRQVAMATGRAGGRLHLRAVERRPEGSTFELLGGGYSEQEGLGVPMGSRAGGVGSWTDGVVETSI
ncbi:unnamed protein product, partial [Urochloa humidicola]